MTLFSNLVDGGSMLISVLPGISSWRFYLQKDDELLSKAYRSHIETKIQELAKKIGIHKPIKLIEKKGLLAGAQAQGIALFSGITGIAIDPFLAIELPETELEFLLAHELSHIKSNDGLWVGIASGIVGIITTLALSILFPSYATSACPILITKFLETTPVALAGFCVSALAFILFNRWREECADKLGQSICSDAARKAAPEFFERFRNYQIQYRNNEEGTALGRLFRRFLITEDGDFRFEILHPALKDRINYLQTNL